MTAETQQDLDGWANNIAQLEPEVVNGIVSLAKELAGNKKLRQSDRDFAQAQVDAINRAKRRNRSRRKRASRLNTNP